MGQIYDLQMGTTHLPVICVMILAARPSNMLPTQCKAVTVLGHRESRGV